MPRLNTIRSNSIPGNDSCTVTLSNSSLEYCEQSTTFGNNAVYTTQIIAAVDYRSRTPKALSYRFTGTGAYSSHFSAGTVTGTLPGGATNRIGRIERNYGNFRINQTSAEFEPVDTMTNQVQLQIFETQSGTPLAVSQTATINLWKARVYMQNNSGGNYVTDSVSYGPGETEVSSGITTNRQVRWLLYLPPGNKYNLAFQGAQIRYEMDYAGFANPATNADFGGGGSGVFSNPQGTFGGTDPVVGNWTQWIVGSGTSLNFDGLTEQDESFRVRFFFPASGGPHIGRSNVCIISANTT